MAAGLHRAGVSTWSNLDVRAPLLEPRNRHDGVSLHHIEQSPGAVYLCVPLRTEREGKGMRWGAEVHLDLNRADVTSSRCSRRKYTSNFKPFARENM